MEVDGQDVEAVYAATREAREHAVSGAGPGVHERRARTASPATTSATRRSTATRTRCAQLRETQDPIELLRARLGISARGVRAHRCRGARPRWRRASSSPRPAPIRAPEDALKWVYADGSMDARLMAEMTYREAVRDALSSVMRDDDRVFIMGEDIAEMGGSMGVTQGMLAEFGPERSATPRSPRSRSWAPASAQPIQGMLPGRRDHVRGLPHDLDGADREPGGEAPDDVGRPGQGAADDSHAGRCRLVAGRPARPAARGLVRPRAGAQGRLRVDTGGRPRPALVVDLRPEPGHLLRAPHPVPDQGRGVRTRSSRSRSGRRACTARAPTCTVVATGRLVHEALQAAEEARAGRHLGRGRRPAHALAARHRDDRGVGARRRPGA